MFTASPLRLAAPISAVFTALLISACGEAEPAPAPADEAPASSTPAPEDQPATPSADAPAQPTSSAGTLPLTPGVYVASGTGCGRPPSAAFRIYDGRGISGSSTADCRATITSRDGTTLQVDQSCEDTYSGKRTSTAQTIVVPNAQGFTLTEGGDTETFSLCAAGEAPAYLEDLSRP